MMEEIGTKYVCFLRQVPLHFAQGRTHGECIPEASSLSETGKYEVCW